MAFTIVKYAGALYLVYLGIQALCGREPEGGLAASQPARLGRIFRDGFIVAMLNPKTAVFFVAFLPQFMSVEVAPILQSITLGSLFVVMAAVTDTAYALAAGAVAPALARARGVPALGGYLGGGAYIGLGVFTAVSGSRSR